MEEIQPDNRELLTIADLQAYGFKENSYHTLVELKIIEELGGGDLHKAKKQLELKGKVRIFRETREDILDCYLDAKNFLEQFTPNSIEQLRGLFNQRQHNKVNKTNFKLVLPAIIVRYMDIEDFQKDLLPDAWLKIYDLIETHPEIKNFFAKQIKVEF